MSTHPTLGKKKGLLAFLLLLWTGRNRLTAILALAALGIFLFSLPVVQEAVDRIWYQSPMIGRLLERQLGDVEFDLRVKARSLHRAGTYQAAPAAPYYFQPVEADKLKDSMGLFFWIVRNKDAKDLGEPGTSEKTCVLAGKALDKPVSLQADAMQQSPLTGNAEKQADSVSLVKNGKDLFSKGGIRTYSTDMGLRGFIMGKLSAFRALKAKLKEGDLTETAGKQKDNLYELALINVMTLAAKNLADYSVTAFLAGARFDGAPPETAALVEPDNANSAPVDVNERTGSDRAKASEDLSAQNKDRLDRRRQEQADRANVLNSHANNLTDEIINLKHQYDATCGTEEQQATSDCRQLTNDLQAKENERNQYADDIAHSLYVREN